jgi:hypothetical protein
MKSDINLAQITTYPKTNDKEQYICYAYNFRRRNEEKGGVKAHH